ncbi:hypothetical protein GMDG_01499 [Pseudogymnoascus destructans 20631-21]|uniref:DUF4219 domain-containing protein n=1 Tax=Pseudogymnoascus destructans (strain ATCC MYA-4855 / 20631-21) TaxID=658429 RepID=L8FVB8_PSED2|nr:hypothetical protein GMDG_01499 [Pseudogymnoascus destructans 20631-21]
MESEHIERSRIQKLSGPNYRNWALQIQIELIDRKVWSTIDDKFTLEYELTSQKRKKLKRLPLHAKNSSLYSATTGLGGSS